MKKELLIIDNYDSFTYNLVQLIEECEFFDYEIYKNDKISLDIIDSFSGIILSPGPGLPENAGIMPDLLKNYVRKKKILGICLGHQAIAQCFGAKLIQQNDITHGKASILKVTEINSKLFENLPNSFIVGRYHSWIVDKTNFPDEELKITSIVENDIIMSIEHKYLPVYGVQFHPESHITQHGKQLIYNWLRI
jgi:anthranilate synthase component 2